MASFLDAYIKGVDESRQNGLANAQQLNIINSIHNAAYKQRQEEAYRQEISQAKSPEEQLAVASKYAGPQGVMAHADLNAKIAANKEATLSRIQQSADQFKMRMELAARNAKTAEDRALLDAQYKQGMLQFKQTALRMTGEKLFDETGIRVGVPDAPQVAPSAPNAMYPQAGNSPDVANLDPQARAAFDLVNSGQATSAVGGAGQPAVVTRPAGSVPAPAPAPVAPMAPPIAPVTPQAPTTPYNVADPELRRVAQAPVQESPVPTAAVLSQPEAAPVAPQMPQFTGSPKQIREAQNKWLLQNSKQGGGTGMGDFTKTGDEFLQTIPATDRAFVQKLARYEIDPKTLSTRGGERERALKMAAQYDPNFDQKNYNTISNAINRFATGPQGNTVRSLNVAIEHMDTARRLGMALNNKDVPAFNAVANEFATQTGQAAPTSFNAVKEILADEVVKGVIGGAGALQDREAAVKKIRDSSSPAQLNAVLDSWTELLGGQMKGLQQQYEGATSRKDFQQKYMSPRTLEAISSTSPLARTVKAMGWNYEPEKYEYRVSGGQVQRRAK
jgi:hypothetical protein